jgi:hypothetical protein
MKELIAGRIMKTMKDEEGLETQRSPAEIMAEAILEGMEGKLVLSHNQYGDVIANPLHAVKLYQDYMLKAKELAIRKAELDKKQKGATGGIRIVLPSHVADPLLRPGQPPRPLRLLGQDPSKPLPGAGTPDDNPPAGSSPARGGPVPLDRQPGGQGGRRDDGAQAPPTPASKADHVSPDARAAQRVSARSPQRRRRPRPSAAVNPNVGTMNPRKGSMLPN